MEHSHAQDVEFPVITICRYISIAMQSPLAYIAINDYKKGVLSWLPILLFVMWKRVSLWL